MVWAYGFEGFWFEGFRLAGYRFEGLQGLFDGVEVGQFSGIFEYFGVADDAVAVNDESGAFGHAFHVEPEGFVQGVVFFADGFVEVGQEWKVEALLLFPFVQGVQAVHGNRQNLGVQLLVISQAVAHHAQFFGANARECQGVKEQNHVFAPKILQAHQGFIAGTQAEVGGFVAGIEHIFDGNWMVVRALQKYGTSVKGR